MAKLWWVPLVCLVPFVGLLVIKGWRLDIIRRRMTHRDDPLPDLTDGGRFLVDGFWLYLVTLVYHLPLVVIMAATLAHTIEGVIEIFRWAGEALSESKGHGVSILWIVLEVVFHLLCKLAVPVVYHYLLKPFLYAGLLRYAMTGRPG